MKKYGKVGANKKVGKSRAHLKACKLMSGISKLLLALGVTGIVFRENRHPPPLTLKPDLFHSAMTLKIRQVCQNLIKSPKCPNAIFMQI